MAKEYPNFRSVTIEIPNAEKAIDFQNHLINKKLGAYEEATNSCLTHIFDVLESGGKDFSSNSEKLKFLLKNKIYKW